MIYWLISVERFVCLYVSFINNNQTTIKTYIDDKCNINLLKYYSDKCD